MDIKPMFNRGEIQAFITKQIEGMNQFILNELQLTGLEFVKNARLKAADIEYNEAINSLSNAKGVKRAIIGPETPGFNDRTGNLRSSIGFLIIKNGKILEEDFEQSEKGTDKATGKSKAYEFAYGISNSNSGYALVVVAGMQYAAAVEALGFDVLTGSSFEAEDQLKKSLEKVKSKFNK